MNLNLQNKTFFITASSSGIGTAIAQTFLSEGANVIINGRDKEKLSATADNFEASFPNQKVYCFCGDMENEKTVEDIPLFLESNKLKILDGLILNLGSGKKIGSNMDVYSWKSCFEKNIFSAVNTINNTIGFIKESIGGNIVFISSIAAKESIPAPYYYSSAKLSILSLVKQLSIEYANYNIRVNAVLPGNIFFKGGRWDEIISANPSIEENYIKKETPLGRFGTPNDVANMVVFFCSDRCSYITGTNITIDGGQTKSFF